MPNQAILRIERSLAQYHQGYSFGTTVATTLDPEIQTAFAALREYIPQGDFSHQILCLRDLDSDEIDLSLEWSADRKRQRRPAIAYLVSLRRTCAYRLGVVDAVVDGILSQPEVVGLVEDPVGVSAGD